MKNNTKCLKNTLIALLGSVILFAACNKDTETSKSTACDITSFSVDAMTWNIKGLDITRPYPAETAVGVLLKPTINLSPGATVDPPADQEQDFFKDDGVKYTVTAVDGVTKKIYTAKATRTQYSNCDIVSFKVDTVQWAINDSLITHAYDGLIDLPEKLTPTITLSPGATINPPADQEQDFFAEAGVKYTVTSEDGATTKNYIVKARGSYSGCDIVKFIAGGEEWALVDGTLFTYTFLTRPASYMALIPTITLSTNATVTPPMNQGQNFFREEGVQYTVTSEDGKATKTYTVKAILNLGVTGEIDGSQLIISGVGPMEDFESADEQPWREGMGSVTSIVIREGVTSVGLRAFQDFASVTSVTIPNSVTIIQGAAFRYCHKLTSVFIPDQVTVIGMVAFEQCPLTSVTIGQSVHTIKQFAFHSCEKLTSITIPSSVITIENHVFHRCRGLNEVINYRATPQELHEYTFGDTTSEHLDLSSMTLKVPDGSVDAYKAAPIWKDFGKIEAIN
jgi:hypothetical protein